MARPLLLSDGLEPEAPLPARSVPESRPSAGSPPLSVVMATYNRGPLLADAVESLLAQCDPATPFELIVVDNNSTDDTRRVMERFESADPRVRYLFEARQGVSFARNTGLAASRAPLVAFTDDDVVADPTWVASIVRAFQERPAADVIGGRVLPIWPAPPPAWLTADQWGPLALVDYGESPFQITPDHPICLVTANVVFRRSVFDEVGTFATRFQRIGDSVGSLEDHELLLRVLRSGRTVVYDPRLVIRAPVQHDRLDVEYHRRWRRGHGHFHALLRSEQLERSGRGTVLGVPVHLYRNAASHAVGWVMARVKGDAVGAFRHEAELLFFAGFFRTRRREFFETPRHERRRTWPGLRLVRPLQRRAFHDARERI